MTNLFSPFDLSGLSLPNRIVMAPMTRSRSLNNIADERVALYYAQRATAGLIVTEGTPVSSEAQGFLFTPGIFTPEQVIGWRLATQSVRSAGGHIFVQLWHVGRISHPSLQLGERVPVSASERQAPAKAFGRDKNGVPAFVATSKPRMLPTAEVARVVQDFAEAARCAVDAGFDGVELHGASGYLFDQFLNPSINDRTDRYGGTIGNRLRFILETVDAVSAAIGRERVGIRLSPWGTVNDNSRFDNTEATFLALGEALGERGIAYVHVTDQTGLGYLAGKTEPEIDAILRLLSEWRPKMVHTALILAGAMTQERANVLIGEGAIDLAAFGQPFIANPDLVARLRNGWPLAIADGDTFYTGGAHGYIDYPPYATDRSGPVVPT